MIHFERAYKTCCTLSLFLGEHREIIVLFQETQNTDLLKVVQDFILFLLLLRNLTSVFMSSFGDWKGSSCPPVFERQMPVFSNGPFPSQQDGIVQPLTAQEPGWIYGISGELNKLHLAIVKWTLFWSLPSPDTQVQVVLSDWQFCLNHPHLHQNTFESRSLITAFREGGKCHKSPSLPLGLPCLTQPFCFQAVTDVLLSPSHNSSHVWIYFSANTFTCSYTWFLLFHSHASNACPLEMKWMTSSNLIWDGKCRHFIAFSVNSGVNFFPTC